jgi:hypothetical protein
MAAGWLVDYVRPYVLVVSTYVHVKTVIQWYIGIDYTYVPTYVRLHTVYTGMGPICTGRDLPVVYHTFMVSRIHPFHDDRRKNVSHG